MLRPSWLEIDLGRLERNVKAVRRLISSNRTLIAVVKADAYGHGVLQVGPAMVEAGADVLALGNLHDAISLRNNGFRGRLLLFGSYIAEEVAEQVVEYRCIPSVWDVKGVKAFSREVNEHGHLEVYLKIDTGFHRLGSLPQNALKVAKAIEASPNLSISCVYTHFADPIHGDEFNEQQFNQLVSTWDKIRHAGVEVPLACCASSAVVSTRPDMYLNAVDPGRILYGFYYPSDPPISLDLEPIARSVKTKIIQTKWVKKGMTIGYARKYKTNRRTRIAILPIGWSDGLSREASLRVEMLVHGRRCPVVGAINVEHCILDITDIPRSQTGDEVIIIGKQGKEEISILEHANRTGLSEMEVILQFGKTMNKIYLNDSKKNNQN